MSDYPEPYHRTLRRGDVGEDVRFLQSALQDVGHIIDNDDELVGGKFGKNVEEAVADFQSSMGLDADGVADKNTLKMLSNL